MTTPLPWADPPFALVQRIYRDAARTVPTSGCTGSDQTFSRQVYRRKIHLEFHRRLAASGVYVEGM